MLIRLSRKTKILNIFRSVFKTKAIEKLLLFFISKKTCPALVKKMVPNNYQYKKNTLRDANIDGIKFQLDISDYLQHSAYFDLKTEPYDVLFDLVKPGFHIFDIGVNYGYTLLEMVNRTGDNGKLYGFEPVPILFEKAKHNISLNNFSNITLVNKAVSTGAGELYFDNNDSIFNSGGTRMSFDNTSKNKVSAVSIDDFARSINLQKLDLIKADIEGFEMEMLKGAIQTLGKFKPILFLELNNELLGKAGSSGAEMIGYLNEIGYKVCNAENFELLTPANDFTNIHIDVLAIIPHIHDDLNKTIAI